MLDNISKWIYNKDVTKERQERRQKMELEEMNKADLIAILTAIREAAKKSNENNTVQLVETILEEIRKK